MEELRLSQRIAARAARDWRLAVAERAEAMQFLAWLERSLLTLHLEKFPEAVRAVVPLPAQPDVIALRAALKTQALRGVSIFNWAKRRQGKKWADEVARTHADVEWQRRLQQCAAEQARVDNEWDLLLAHDEQAVYQTLEAAFEDDQSAAICIDAGTEGADRFVTVLILFGPQDFVPERGPAQTATGIPTLHKRTKTERNDFYVRALGSKVLATVKEGFAVVPNATEFRVVVLRVDPQASSPAAHVEWIYAARFPRHWTAKLPWNALDPGEILLNAPGAKMQRGGVAGGVVGMSFSDEPGMAEIVSVVRAAV
jgi:hypothetical protein